MKLTKKEFLDAPRKAVTLIGMSGAGKTYISCKLEEWGWCNYSCDYEIGTKYLKDDLDAFSGGRNVSVEDLGVLSDYIGKLGDTAKGGLELALFRQRQKAYYDAEVDSLKAIGNKLSENPNAMFVNDSTGSLCEIEDETLLADLGSKTLFVYLKIDEAAENVLLQRANECPKPLFYPRNFLTDRIKDFMEQNNLSSVNQIDPDGFARWVFPLLLAARKPKYQRLADLYGVTIPADKFQNISSSKDFISIIAEHMNDDALVA